MADGRRQDGDEPLAMRRRDDGGRGRPLCGTEEVGRDTEPHCTGVAITPAERKAGAEDGCSVIEASGTAVRKTQTSTGAGRP